jgi:predicted DNA-binding WGR domain protein
MKRRFELVEGTASKFWEIEVSGGTMTVRFGRIGTAGQTKVKKLGANAAAAAATLVAEKTKKGYREIGAKKRPAAKKAPAGRKAPAAKAAAAVDDGLTAVLERIAARLVEYAPERRASLRGAKSLAPLEKLTPVHAALRALRAWADGAEELIVPSASDLEGAMDLLSVKQAAADLKLLRQAAAFPAGLCPFAGDGAGNYVTADDRGHVLDWDHETRKTRKLAPSVAALLARTEQALARGVLYGGPEPKPGSVDKRVAAAEKLLARDPPDIDKVLDATALLADADAHRVRKALRDKLVAAKTPASALERFYGSFAISAASAGAWDDALAALAARGKVYDPHDTWKTVGRIALEAGALEPASRAFAKGSSLEARVGAAVVAKLSGRDPSKHLRAAQKDIASETERVNQRLARDEAAGRAKPNPDLLDYLARLLVHRATLEQLRGDARAAAATLVEARARCGRRSGGSPRPTLDAYARAVGLVRC